MQRGGNFAAFEESGRRLRVLAVPVGHGGSQVIEEHAAHEVKIHFLVKHVDAPRFSSKPRLLALGLRHHEKHSRAATSFLPDEQCLLVSGELVDLRKRDDHGSVAWV